MNYLRQKVKVDGISIYQDKWKITVKCKTFLKKTYLKQMAKAYLSKKKLSQFVHVVGNGRKSLRLQYY